MKEHTHECVRIAVHNAKLLAPFDFGFLPETHRGDGCPCHEEFAISEADMKEFRIFKRPTIQAIGAGP